MYDRKLLAKLSLCAWRVLSEYLKASVSVDNPVPGCVIAVQTFGEFLNFNPHLHIIATGWSFRFAPLLAHASWMAASMAMADL